MKWCFLFSVSFLLITFKIQACQGPEDAASLNKAIRVVAASRTDKTVNKALIRAQSCELPKIVDDRRGRHTTIDVKRLQERENPVAIYSDGYRHPGKKLIGRAEKPESPKGSPRDPSKLQKLVASANEDDNSLQEEESVSSICVVQRRSTFSE